MADGDGDRGVDPADVPNESDTLITVLIVSESPDSGGIPCVHLGSTSWRAGDANGPGRGTDMSKGLADVSRARADASNTSNRAEMDGMSCDEGAGTYLSVRDVKCVVHATDGVGSQSDASIGHSDVPCVDTDTITPANMPEIVSIPRKRTKPPDLPIGAAKRTPDKPNGCGDHMDGPSVHTDVHSVGTGTQMAANETEHVRMHRIGLQTKNSPVENEQPCSDEPDGCRSHADRSSAHTDTRSIGNATETAENETETVRTRQNGSRTQNSPNVIDIAMPELPGRWRKVSIGGGDVYVPFNAPIAIPTRRIVFGRPESGDEAIAPSVEGERAGDGNSDGYKGDGDVDGTMSSGHIDSSRVEEALLAAESQHTRYSSRLRRNNLPVSSWPPIQPERRPYGHVRRRQRRGRLKIERINEDQVSKAQRVETTHLTHAHATQPPGNTPNRAYGIYRPRRQRGRIKIVPTNVSRTRNGGNAYLRRVTALRSNRRPKRQIRRLSKLTFKCRMQGERRRDDGDYG